MIVMALTSIILITPMHCLTHIQIIIAEMQKRERDRLMLGILSVRDTDDILLQNQLKDYYLISTNSTLVQDLVLVLVLQRVPRRRSSWMVLSLFCIQIAS